MPPTPLSCGPGHPEVDSSGVIDVSLFEDIFDAKMGAGALANCPFLERFLFSGPWLSFGFWLGLAFFGGGADSSVSIESRVLHSCMGGGRNDICKLLKREEIGEMNKQTFHTPARGVGGS